MLRGKILFVVIGALVVSGLASCGSRVSDSASNPPGVVTTRAASKPTSSANAPSTTAAAAKTTTTLAATTTSVAGAVTTSSTAAVPTSSTKAGLTEFCAATRLLNLGDVTAFEAYDAAAAVKMVFTFDKIQKAAPPELVDGFNDMRPLVEELNQQVKAGKVTDRASLKAWLLGLHETNPDALDQWVRGQLTVVPYINLHCPSVAP